VVLIGIMSSSKWIWALAVGLWIIGVSVGFVALAEYTGTPGSIAHEAPAAWPSASALEREAGRAKLLMFVHPECSCSRASLNELERLLVGFQDASLAVEVAFVLPSGAPESFADTSLWARANAIPGVRATRDRDGKEAARFGAATSGHTLLYGADGALLFSGGLTRARGHEGPSAGSARLATLLRRGHTDRSESAIFGCALEDDGGERRRSR
jgi:hypothetical protein